MKSVEETLEQVAVPALPSILRITPVFESNKAIFIMGVYLRFSQKRTFGV
jgi:hypothetical protein